MPSHYSLFAIRQLLTIAGFALLVFFSSCKYFAPKDDRDFAIADTSAVQKIFITDKGHRQILLTREKSGWKVNGKYFVRRDAIQLLLAGIHDVRVNRPVSIKEHNNVVMEMASQAKKVEIFTNENEPIKTYYVGGVVKDYEGNFFLMDGSSQPYVVEIPGFNGEVSVRYILAERDWRSRNLTHLIPAEIKKVSVQYFDERKSESYSIEAKNLNEFSITPNGETDFKKCFALFSEFRNLNALAFALDNADVDSFKRQKPFAVLDVQAVDNSHQILELSHTPVNQHTKKQFDEFGKPMSFDSENYFAWANNHTDFLLIQDFALRNILKLRKDFLK